MIAHIRYLLKRLFDSIQNPRIKNAILLAGPFWVASLLTGLVAVVYAEFFRQSENINKWLFTHTDYWMLVITPALFALSYFLIQRFDKAARGSGIPQVLAALELSTPRQRDRVNKLLNIEVIWLKISSSMLMVIGGAAIGREGPTIQIAASVFREVHHLLPGWWPTISKKNMIITGAAAGLAAAFNTPLGGVVFAVEELSKTHIRFFRTSVFTSVIIAGVTAQGILGSYLYLGYADVSKVSYTMLGPVLLVSATIGIAGAFSGALMLRIMRWKSTFSFKWQSYLYLAVVAILIVLAALFIDPVILGSGKETMNSLLFQAEKHPAWTEPVLRFIGPILSFTVGSAGGIFAPALSSGAAIAAWLSQWFNLTNGETNLLILTGMIAFLTGITRTPFTAAILVLEMTDRHSVIFYLLAAGIIANSAAGIVSRHSFYEYLKVQYMREAKKEEKPQQPPLPV